ncbi:hypothetical protein [Roseicyclus sp.]|uniref:hypothetical protein n=1 Tax=Roseicyclus sp. TaxID=1914329 RepID=UPI003F9EF41F
MRAALLGIAGLIALFVGVLDLSGDDPLNPLVEPAEAAADNITLATTAVYVSLRVINSALSVAQEIEVGAAVVAQVGAQPLKVLEPVDDTVERVASVVFAVAAGAAVASVGIGPVASLGLVVLGVGLLGRCGCALWPGAAPALGPSRRALSLGAALGLVLPAVFALGVAMGQWMTEARWNDAIATLDAVTTEAATLLGAGDAEEIAEELAGETTGLLGNVWDRMSAAWAAVGDAPEALERYTEAVGVFLDRADDLFHASLTLIGIFALRILVLPALLLWGAMTILRQSLGV